MSPDFVTQEFIFHVGQDFENQIAAKLHEMIERIAAHRSWLINPPIFWDEVQDTVFSTSRRLVGGVHEIYSSWPPNSVPPELDKQLLDEVSYIIDELRSFSKEHDLIFECYLETIFVGAINSGIKDRSLSEIFLGEWRKILYT